VGPEGGADCVCIGEEDAGECCQVLEHCGRDAKSAISFSFFAFQSS
jgi:hypothetical protein